MGSVFRGAVNATNLVGLKNKDAVLIIAERLNVSVGRAIEHACKLKTNKIDFFVAEDFGQRPLRFVPKSVLDSVKKADVVFFLVRSARDGRLNERFTFRMPLTEIAVKRGARFAAMVGIDENCMKQGMCADYKKIQSLSKKVFGVLKKARTISVMSSNGTFLLAEFSPKIKWIVADGKIVPGDWSNLPDGEVYTAPLRVNGVAVIDGSLGDVFSRKYGSLQKTPLYWFIKDSRVQKVLCPKNKKLQKEFESLLRLDKNSNRIGEFALGTNLAVKKIIGNLLQDEKIIGVHMAVGNPYSELTGADWSSGVHCDGVMIKPTVFVDGVLLMRSGKYIL